MITTIRHLAALVVAITCAGSAATAADFSFTGNFSGDNDVALFEFSLGAPTAVTLKTLSYAGGINAAGTVIPRGGFDPIISLFDGAGNFLAFNDDGGAAVPADAVTGQRFDAFLNQALGTGTYIVALTQSASFPLGPTLSAGFTDSFRTGFVDAVGSTRTSAWALDILNVAAANQQQQEQPQPPGVPETGSALALFALSMGLLAGVRRKLGA